MNRILKNIICLLIIVLGGVLIVYSFQENQSYIFIGSCFILISILIFIIMSGVNKRGVKETFQNTDKVLIYILSVIILTAAAGYIGVRYMTTEEEYDNHNNEQNIDSNSSTNNTSYLSSTSITEDIEVSSGTYESSSSNENTIDVTGNINVTLKNITVNKTGDGDSGDNSSFYGTNSAILARNGANLTLDNITVTTNGVGANGVFSYGGSATTNNTSSDDTTITISDSVITTNKDNSGGIMVTGGGILYAYNLTVSTAGTSSASIRSDRGGGILVVDGGTYETSGSGSPSIYSTADITVKNAILKTSASEGIVVEGANSVSIENVTLTSSNTKLNGLSTTYKNIFIYQSQSGDAKSGQGSFKAVNSIITTNNGDTFYITNTSAYIYLENNTITNSDNFLRAQSDSWGTSGSNGGNVTLVMSNQEAGGTIVIDEVSTLDMELTDTSSFKGAINTENTAKSISLKLDSTSSLELTGNTYITSLDDEDSTYSNIILNGYKLYVNGVELK